VVEGPTVTSRGWATDRDRADLHEAVAAAVRSGLVLALGDPDATSESVERVVRRSAGSTVSERTRRRPMIVPLVTFV